MAPRGVSREMVHKHASRLKIHISHMESGLVQHQLILSSTQHGGVKKMVVRNQLSNNSDAYQSDLNPLTQTRPRSTRPLQDTVKIPLTSALGKFMKLEETNHKFKKCLTDQAKIGIKNSNKSIKEIKNHMIMVSILLAVHMLTQGNQMLHQ